MLKEKCKRLSDMQRTKGFTMIELLVVMSIMVILLAISAPSFQAFLQKERVTAASNKILRAVLLTRSEAINQELPVTFTVNADGWDVTDNDGVLILTDSIVDAGITLGIDGDAGDITFGSNGRPAAPMVSNSDYLTISSGDKSLFICFTPSGRPSIQDGGNC